MSTIRRRKLPPTFYWEDNNTIKLVYKGTTRRGFKNLEDAEIAKAKLVLQIDSEQGVTSNKTTFNSISSDYLKHKYQSYQEERITFGTYDRDAGIIKNYVDDLFKGVTVKNLNGKKLSKIRNEIFMLDLHSTTKNKTLAVIKRILMHGRKYHNIKEDYSIFLDNFPKTKAEKKNDKLRFKYIWTNIDFEHFLSFVEEKENKVMFTLFYKHGLRLGEALALQYKDVNFKSNKIKIKDNVTRKTESKKIELKDTKTSESTRTIYVGKNTINLIQDLYNDNKNYYGFNNSWFLSNDDKPQNPRKFDTVRINAMNAAGFEGTVTHDLRHMFVSNIWGKAPLTAVSSYIGHKNVSVTLEIYTHLTEKDSEEMNNYIDSSL